MDRDRDAEGDDVPPPEYDIRAKLKHVAHYAMLGFAPVVSMLALGVALFASDNDSDPAQLNNLKSNIEILNLSLLAAKSDLDNLKFSMSREKSQQSGERKKKEEIDATIVRNVTRLQEKLKISPTLEEQLRAAAKAAAAASQVVTPASAAAPAPVMPDKPQAAAPVPPGTEKKSAAVPVPAETKKESAPKGAAETAVPAAAEKNPAPQEAAKKPVPKPAPKLSPQVKAIKDAIDEYNKQ